MLKPSPNEIRKPTKTISGITPVALMLPPRKCKHGTCIYCPSLNVPQSYTPKSPVVLRARALDYDSYKQVKTRLDAFEKMGHPIEKIEIIIMGGTFLEYPKKFQYSFVKGIYDALNNRKSRSLEEAKKKNENSKHRCVALCIETRPDVCSKEQIKEMLNFGATRVELGVQMPDDRLYKLTKRGHITDDVVEATRLLKDSGYKVFYHMMVNLPGSNPEKDLKLFKKIFSDERFKPDGIKIYPCQVIQGAELEDLYWQKKYAPYPLEVLKDLLIKLKLIVPRYCRIMRIMREIPLEYLVAGTKDIGLRKELQENMHKKGLKCNCIRCREVGFFLNKGRNINPNSIKLCRIDYNASKGKEIFLTFEDVKNDVLIALLRLRIPYNPFLSQINKKTAIIREMHTYGASLNIGKRKEDLWQHKGYGKLLLKEAERIALEEFNMDKILVISGIGVRKYFYNQDYKLDGPYVSKGLKQ
ncbi:MAG: tRNA uridine(34) 5-carboxymethylaminomethyl modification radical SAM/GNAT enzyme Elp3 [Candidatus Diapherotrites archaeon]